MNIKKEWLYDEFRQVGKDYTDKKEVNLYNETHSDFRDIKAQSVELIEKLELNNKHVVIDYGCGTGIFAIEAAKKCKKVFAVDVSQEMLGFAKPQARGIDNIEFIRSGFLNFNPGESTVDFIFTTFSFHHLPDFWKKIALDKVYNHLKEGGILYIKDIVIETEFCINNINALIDYQFEAGGDFLKRDAEMHFKEEYSTFDWILDGLLERCSFEIVSKNITNGLLGEYICKKQPS